MMGVKKLKTQRVTERQIGIGVKHGTNFPTSMPSFMPRNIGTLLACVVLSLFIFLKSSFLLLFGNRNDN
jgi:hypothetical protein